MTIDQPPRWGGDCGEDRACLNGHCLASKREASSPISCNVRSKIRYLPSKRLLVIDPAMPNDDEIEAVKFYSGSGYSRINSYLRGEEYADRQTYQLVRLLDRAISRSVLDRDCAVYRGIDGDAASQLRAAGVDVGDRFRDPAFTSASADPGPCRIFAAWPEGGLILKIVLRTGMFALDIAPFSAYPDEKEFLLPRNLTFEVIGVSDGIPEMLEVEIR